MRILITGNMGYVGARLSKYLRENQRSAVLVGVDTGFFAHSITGTQVHPEVYLDEQHYCDVRDFPGRLLEGVDAVVHLAAVSNDPMGNEFEAVTQEINRAASVKIAKAAAQAGVKNFVFASSCSMYGAADRTPRKETDPVNPLTAYARSKIGTEDELSKADLGDMVFTSLRFATACGMSDRLRLDLVLNDFVACALSSGEITVLSDGTPWRPLIDVEDMSRAILWAVRRRPENGGQFLAVNAGRNEYNYQVRDLAFAVARHLSGTAVSINTSAQPDNRSYKVDFSLFEQLAPDFMPRVSLDESISRLTDGLRRMEFSDVNFRDSPFMRLRTLQNHISSNSLGSDLRWLGKAVA